MNDLKRPLAERVAQCLGQRVVAWRPAVGGYSTALRLIVTCVDGTSVFVKAASDARTATWLRTEYGVYSQVQAPFLPTVRAWVDDDGFPFLVLEDLTEAVWQPTWTTARIAQVLATLRHVAATRPTNWLPALEERRTSPSGWARVAQEPELFLRLGLCSRAWVANAINALVAAEARVQFAGDDLLHGDIRSDNLCFVGDRIVLVDWNWACRGNGIIDVAAWLPSLHLEGGPLPDSILPDHPYLAAMISGYFAARAGLPAEQASPHIRALQRAQLQVGMAWVARALGLPPPQEGVQTASTKDMEPTQ